MASPDKPITPDSSTDGVRERLLAGLDTIERTLTGPERYTNNPVSGLGAKLHLLDLLKEQETPTARMMRAFVASIDVDGPAQTNAYGVCLLTRRHLDAGVWSESAS